jgi:MFS family permease
MIAGAHSIPILFIGRVLQGVAASAVWIVGFATIADTVSQDNIGTVMGLTMSFVNLGMIGGPAASGFLLGAAGYWATWLIPLLILTVDLVARLVMIESPLKNSSSRCRADVAEVLETSENLETSLLSSHQNSQQSRIATTF